MVSLALLTACADVAESTPSHDTRTTSAQVSVAESGCIDVNLADYNLFVLEDYSGGHDVVGKVAVGGNLSMTNFSVGNGLDASDTANVLVTGGNLALSRGAVFGDTRYGGTFTTDPSVIFPRGAPAQGTPIDFAARGAQLKQMSAQLAALPVNGTTRREGWGGIFVRGTDASANVVDVAASAFTGAKYFSIEAPAGSLMVVNIRGASATFTGFGIAFSGGIDQHGVLFNFVDTTRIEARGFGFWGTVLAPYAHVDFSDGSFDGGIYARSFTGNAEGHINPLPRRSLCLQQQPEPECIKVKLDDYNLFLLKDYSGGHDVVGKVAVGGSMSMTDFSVGNGLETSDTNNVLVVGGNLSLSRGAVFGDVRYGGNFSTNPSVIFPRGAPAQGMPIDFAARGAQLKQMSAQLAALPVNGTTRREGWGGIFVRGTDASANVVDVAASAFTGAKYFSIEAPAGSLMVVNIRGASATFTGFGIAFSGGIDQHGVLFNFVDTTRIEARGFGFWGTVLAPYAHVDFSDGSFDGGIYAESFEGNAEGHINPLPEQTLCR
ncbi:choice-of-anchor A family protein [Hyalangium gracile]|uniref:choice-of-anchor A family protein n=1 Tax=Hyalangium gracile TaxID=394092 RepID=UPI001CCC8DF0|nr:choice-of-anchor A family protein [Hyalangium gracile]